jgi:hypothetical protein
MADEATTEKPKPVTPLGAQVMRALRRGLKTTIDDVTMKAGPLDDCAAKSDIGGIVGGLTEHMSGIEKAWAKYYKEHDLDAEDEAPAEMKADKPDPDPNAETIKSDDADADDELDDDDIDAALAALDDDPDPEPKEKPAAKAEPAVDEDDEDRMSPEQKRQYASRIRRLERELAELPE